MKVVASDHTRMRTPRNVRVHITVGSHLGCDLPKNWEKVRKWLLNYARNANKPIPVESAITMIKLNAPRRLPSMRSPNLLSSHQKRKKIEVRYDLEQI